MFGLVFLVLVIHQLKRIISRMEHQYHFKTNVWTWIISFQHYVAIHAHAWRHQVWDAQDTPVLLQAHLQWHHCHHLHAAPNYLWSRWRQASGKYPSTSAVKALLISPRKQWQSCLLWPSLDYQVYQDSSKNVKNIARNEKSQGARVWLKL